MSSLLEPSRGCLPIAAGDEEVNLLRGLCEAYSPSGREGEAASFLVDAMRRLGWNAYVDDAGNAVGEVGEGRRTLVFLGHIDTVPGWIPVRIEDGALHGRGAVDAKGSIAAFVSGLARAARCGPLPFRVLVAAVVEEETDSSRGARSICEAMARRGGSPDWCVIGEPSGAHAITLGYRGRLSAEVLVERPGVHSASGVASAAETAVDLWLRVREFCRSRSLPGPGFQRLDASLRSMACETDGLADRCRMSMVFRLPPGLDPGDLSTALQAEFEGAGFSFSGGVPAYRGDKNSAIVRAFLTAIRATGGRPTFKLKSGTSDMNVVGPAWRCPIVAYGPGDSALDHTPTERLPLDEYATAIEVCARAIETLSSC